MRPDVEAVKRQIPLLQYLYSQGWSGRPIGCRNEVVGLCPLHRDQHPSFYVNTARNVFFCHGCGRGGDLLRFVEIFLDLPFHEALTHLKRQLDPTLFSEDELLSRTALFYASLLRSHHEAMTYLQERGINDRSVMDRFDVGYAPGACLRAYLADSGFPLDLVEGAGLIDNRGRDTFYRRIVIPCIDQGRVVNLYGRSVNGTARHRFLPRPKGSLFAWHTVRDLPHAILVEGLFDLLTLWQAGFVYTTCGYGTYLTRLQLAQLCDTPGREVFIAFDSDRNGAGQHAALSLQQRLRAAGIRTYVVILPQGHDPNSYFLAGAAAADFQARLDEARGL